MERCANCERQIGNLETPHVWNDRSVCPECFVRLESSTSQPNDVDAPAAHNDRHLSTANSVSLNILGCCGVIFLIFLIVGGILFAVQTSKKNKQLEDARSEANYIYLSTRLREAVKQYLQNENPSLDTELRKAAVEEASDFLEELKISGRSFEGAWKDMKEFEKRLDHAKSLGPIRYPLFYDDQLSPIP